LNDISWKKPVRKNGALPIYVQIAEILDARIKAHGSANYALPSEGDLAREFGTSRVTVRQALKQLESRGVIYSAHGRGYFKTAARLRGISGFRSFTTEVRKQGFNPASIVIDYQENRRLPKDFQQHLETNSENDEDFIFLRRIRTIDANPVAVEDTYLPHKLYQGASRAIFENTSLYEQMAENWGIVPGWADALFEPTVATDDEAQALHLDRGAPVMTIWRITVTDADQAIEYVKSVYRGDGFMLNVNRYRL